MIACLMGYLYATPLDRSFAPVKIDGFSEEPENPEESTIDIMRDGLAVVKRGTCGCLGCLRVSCFFRHR